MILLTNKTGNMMKLNNHYNLPFIKWGSRYILCLLLVTSVSHAQNLSGRVVTSFDEGWLFLKNDAKGAEATSFNDADWRKVNVPHDWSIEGPYNRDNKTGRGGGYLPAGVGWYRKYFDVPGSYKSKKVFMEFDGVMANSDVWINGFHLGKRPYGYISFEYDLTGHLNFEKGNKNVIAVRADNSLQPASRYYTGAGIYRHVRLKVMSPVHIAHWGTYITTPEVTEQSAKINMQTDVLNESTEKRSVTVETVILGVDGKSLQKISTSQEIAAGKSFTFQQPLTIEHPKRWSLEDPFLYKAEVIVRSGSETLDNKTTPFGIRTAKFEAATGFWLNDKNIKLKGVCLHHDGGAVGAAVPLAVWERRLKLLKEVGANAIRTSHNPVAPEFLDLCDRMGFLIMDETFDTWNAKKSSSDFGYNVNFTDWWQSDTKDMVMRDRNHPSIIIYSVGNEIHDNLNDSSGFRKYRMQQDLVHSIDPTRPVTMALFRPGMSHVYDNGLAGMMDVVGQNYRENELVAAHEKNPQWKVIGTENGHTQAAWLALRDKPFMAGQFLWTGFDYLGENDWPLIANGQGLFDRTGGKRNIAYQRESWWSDKPMVYVMRKEGNAGAGEWISDWSPTDIDTYDEARVQVFSNCDEVELFLNGKSVGSKPRMEDNASPRTWTITFQKGTLKAVAKNKGVVVAEQELSTVGKPAKIVLSVDKQTIGNNWDDVAYVTAMVTDENGNPCLASDSKIKFTIAGAGVIAGVDNADLSSSEPYQTNERWAYKGRCIAIVRANSVKGNISVSAIADDLKTGTISLSVK